MVMVGLIEWGVVVVCLRCGSGRGCLVMGGFGDLMGLVVVEGRNIISRRVDYLGCWESVSHEMGLQRSISQAMLVG